MSTLKDLHNLLVKDARVLNRATKATRDDKLRYKIYGKKNQNIIKAVELILSTKTTLVSYEIKYDTDKEMHYIVFTFNKMERYIKEKYVVFHLVQSVYTKIKELEDDYKNG